MEPKIKRPIGVIQALKEAIEREVSETGDGVKPTVFTRYDDIRLKEFDSYPAIVLVAPDPEPFYQVQRQDFIYDSPDYENGIVKERHPPKAVKLNYNLVVMCVNPDNDLILFNDFMRFEDTIPEIHAPIYENQEEYLNVVLYWHHVGKIKEANMITRSWTVKAKINIPHKKYKSRKLLNPTDPVNYNILSTDIAGNPLKSACLYAPIGELAFSLDVGETELELYEDTKQFPISGTVKFLRNDEEFVYIDKTPKKLIGSSGVKYEHLWGEEIQLIE